MDGRRSELKIGVRNNKAESREVSWYELEKLECKRTSPTDHAGGKIKHKLV